VGGRFTPGKDPVPIVLQEAGWAPGPVWTGVKNLALTGIQCPDRPTHSQSLYRQRYPGPQNVGTYANFKICFLVKEIVSTNDKQDAIVLGLT